MMFGSINNGMLPFEKPNDAQRLYCCFVCGLEFKEFEQFKLHIFDKHEEGREYIRCPLARCGAPVRDIRSNFRVRHPTEKVPKAGQMRAIVWKDQRDPNSKKKRKKIAFEEGYFPSKKNGKQMHYRSGYEHKVYEILERSSQIMRYEVEPFPVPYWFRGEKHNYFPDLMIYFSDGHTEVWEVKPQAQTSYEINEAKWVAADNYCNSRGWLFEVKTEKGIQQMRRELL